MELRALIDSEPANAARDDAAVLAWLREPVNVFQDVQWLEFQIWRHQAGVTNATLQTIAANPQSERATAAQYMLDVVQAGQPFAASDARVRAMITDANLPAPMRDALATLATKSVERWQAQAVTLHGQALDRVTLSAIEASK